MNYKQIVRSFHKIAPTDVQKQRMLTFIVKKKENTFFWKRVLRRFQEVSLVGLVLLICMVTVPKKEGFMPLARSAPNPSTYHTTASFVFEDDTYVALPQFQEIENVGKHLFTITVGDDRLLGLSVYEDLTNKEHVLVLFENQYQIFERNLEEER